MLWLNWKAQRDLKKKKKSVSKGGRGRGQTMNRWHLRKADLCWPVRKSAVSQWSRVKKGNESMRVGERRGESTLYSLGCQFTSKPSQPPTSQPCLKGCCFGCRVPTTTYRQTEWVWDLPDESTFSTNTHTKLSLCLSPSDTVPLLWTLLD